MKNRHLAWDQAHEDAKRQVARYLAMSGRREAGFLKLAKWCLNTEVPLYVFIPTGREKALDSSIGAAAFLAELYYAMLDGGVMCFVEASTGPCFEFCAPDQFPELNRHFNREYRQDRQVRNWTVRQFIAEAERHHAESWRLLQEAADRLRGKLSSTS